MKLSVKKNIVFKTQFCCKNWKIYDLFYFLLLIFIYTKLIEEQFYFVLQCLHSEQMAIINNAWGQFYVWKLSLFFIPDLLNTEPANRLWSVTNQTKRTAEYLKKLLPRTM